MELGRARNGLLANLAARGTAEACAALLRIAEELPTSEAIWVRWRWHECLTASRRQAWEAPSIGTVLKLAGDSRRRWIRDEDDLIRLVNESLERFQKNLSSSPNSRRFEFWESRKGRAKTKLWCPRKETEISDRVAAWLQQDLDPRQGVTLQREVQVQWNERTDIEVRAFAVESTTLRPIEIVVEVKGCWNADLRTAWQTQFLKKYLLGANRTHGIYLVAWPVCDKWNDLKDSRRRRCKKGDPKTAEQALRENIANEDILPCVVLTRFLDCRLP